jgi:hypothetical protein
MVCWTQPEVCEVKMDAEIGSYQDDFAPTDDAPFARASEEEAS